MQGIRNVIARASYSNSNTGYGRAPQVRFVRLMPIFWIHNVPDDEYDDALAQTISYAVLAW